MTIHIGYGSGSSSYAERVLRGFHPDSGGVDRLLESQKNPDLPEWFAQYEH